jgi:hypothetical protein
MTGEIYGMDERLQATNFDRPPRGAERWESHGLAGARPSRIQARGAFRRTRVMS